MSFGSIVAALAVRPLSPFLRGEGRGEGQPQTPTARIILLTRIASNDAMRPLPAGGER